MSPNFSMWTEPPSTARLLPSPSLPCKPTPFTRRTFDEGGGEMSDARFYEILSWYCPRDYLPDTPRPLHGRRSLDSEVRETFDGDVIQLVMSKRPFLGAFHHYFPKN